MSAKLRDTRGMAVESPILSLNAWHLPDTEEYRVMFQPKANEARREEKPALSEDAQRNVERFIQWLRSKRYSRNTIKVYTEAIGVFLRFVSDKALCEIDNNDIVRFNNDYVLKRNLSASYQNQVVNAVKLFFGTVGNRRLEVEKVHRPKTPKTLPKVLSREEVKMLLDGCVNLKHKAMLCTIYACGLRRSELLNLKPENVDSRRHVLIIRQAKGRKDRIAPISEKLIELLRQYYRAYKPQTWLFEGQTVGEKYSEKSLENVLKQAVHKAGIKKPVSLHWLRHSYATHLLEGGTDLRYIQELLGYKSSKTTEIYTHVSTKSIQNIVSPFDTL
jgi:integrase/recombinase XerD